jgi:hypothetical protein
MAADVQRLARLAIDLTAAKTDCWTWWTYDAANYGHLTFNWQLPSGPGRMSFRWAAWQGTFSLSDRDEVVVSFTAATLDAGIAQLTSILQRAMSAR